MKTKVMGKEIKFDSKGMSIAKSIPLEQGDKKPRCGGQWKGKVKIAQDFDELPDTFMAVFRGKNERSCY